MFPAVSYKAHGFSNTHRSMSEAHWFQPLVSPCHGATRERLHRDEDLGLGFNVGALLIRIGFWGYILLILL